MSALAEKRCKPCEGGVAPLTGAQALELMRDLASEWQLAADARSVRREFKFRDFFRTMSCAAKTDRIPLPAPPAAARR